MYLKPLPDIETLCQLLRYDRQTGKLFWRKRPVGMFSNPSKMGSWNTRYAGVEAGTPGGLNKKYITVRIFKRHFLAHRITYKIHHRIEPTMPIDHKDGDGSNNRIENLRYASMTDNNRNQRPQLNKTSKYKGVSFYSKSGSWSASIHVEGRKKHLGYFKDERDAALVYDAAAKKHFGDFARPNF